MSEWLGALSPFSRRVSEEEQRHVTVSCSFIQRAPAAQIQSVIQTHKQGRRHVRTTTITKSRGAVPEEKGQTTTRGGEREIGGGREAERGGWRGIVAY